MNIKKVINGKLYNTEVAELICNYAYGNWGDRYHIFEALYRTRIGAFFLAGSGGDQSTYGIDNGGSTSGGSDIHVIAEDVAKAFVEAHGNHYDYVRCFGEPEEA